MSIGQQILFFISLLGAFNGFVLSIYLFAGKKVKSVATLFLGMLLLMVSIRVTKSVFLYFNSSLPKIYLQIGLSACFLIGPSLYYACKAALTKATTIPASWKWSWGLQLGLIVGVGLAYPYARDTWTWNEVIAYVIYAQWLVYVVATGFLLKPLIKTFFINKTGLQVTEKFWLLIYAGSCLILFVYMLALAGLCRIYISGPVSYSLSLYLSVFFYAYNARYENVLQPRETGASETPVKKKIAEVDAMAWLDKLEKAMLANALYKDPNLKLSDLAQKINISPHQLSQLLNDNLGKSFSTYINEHRIREACKLIATDERLTFEAIGYAVGYNSKSTFYTAFKKVTDTTPALFKESMAKNTPE